MPNNFTKRFFYQFKSPVELLYFYDRNFLDGLNKLYPWQVEILKQFAKDTVKGEKNHMGIVAPNGAGKSQFILAPCAIWLNVAFDNALSYVTSASAAQLDTQTERFIDRFIVKMQKAHEKDLGLDIWDAVKRRKNFRPTNSVIDLFATDEPKRAEGKHPLETDSEFAIFVDEGKSIEKGIYDSLERCLGYTRRLDISSSGLDMGHFFDIHTRPELGWWTRKIVYTDCPHITKTEFDNAILKYGLNDPLVRSIFFSEFSSIEAKTLILREILNRCLAAKITEDRFSNRRMGVDLSGGGDEQVGSIWEGNIQLGQETGRFKDTDQGAKEVIHWQQKWKIKDEDVYIEYDGFNRGIVDNICGRGHEYNKVLSGGKAHDSKRYANRGTELWFRFKRLVEENLAQFINDSLLISQLAGRFYKRQLTSSRIILESKEEARSNGHPSPDRADAAVIAWAGVDVEDYVLRKLRREIDIPVRSKTLITSMEELAAFYEDVAYGNFRRERPALRANGSLDVVLRQSLN